MGDTLLSLFILIPTLVMAYLMWRHSRKFYAPIVVLLVGLVGGATIGHALGLPRPSIFTMSLITDHEVIAYRVNEPEVIWLWVMVDGVPVSYQLPFEMPVAQQLHAEMNKSQMDGRPLMVRRRFDGGVMDNQLVFHVLPPEALPPKH